MPEIYSRVVSTGGGVSAERVTYTDGSGYWIHSGNTGFWSGTFTGPAPGGTPAAVATSTGVNPTETSYSLYGHIIPLSHGKVRIGGEIIAGPWVENGNATFCISFGVPFDPADTRELTEIAFDSEVVWENGAFNTEAFVFRYYPGTLTQAADPIEIAHFGADAVAYRPQMLIWFENLPLAATKFGKIPYVAAVIEDSTAGEVNFGSAFETLAYSPWVNFTPADFEAVDVTDGVSNGGMIIAENAEFLSFIQQFARFYRNWNLLQTDKLRIVDRGARVEPDIVLDRSKLMEQITFGRTETTSVPRVLELSTIDPDADYTIVPSKAVRTLEPINVSASVRTESVYLPVVMDTFTRQSIVTYTKYQEEVTRKKLTAKAMVYGFELEPGDFVAITGLGDDYGDNSFRVIETLHGADYSVEFTAESYLNCQLPPDPYFAYVVLLLGFEGVDESRGAPGFTDESLSAHGTGDASLIGMPKAEQVDTSQYKFGTSSLYLPQFAPPTTPCGLGLVQFPPSNDWCLSSANSDQFTVELWARFIVFTSPFNMLVGCFFSNGGYRWGFAVSPGGELKFFSSANGSTLSVDMISSGAALTTDAWYHLAVDKDSSGKIRIYKNGVMVASDTPANSIQKAVSDNPLDIGCLPGNNGVAGWIDELRITKGICRYGSDGGFVVPTAAFPRGVI